MTALRFQTGEENQTSLASRWGKQDSHAITHARTHTHTHKEAEEKDLLTSKIINTFIIFDHTEAARCNN